MDFGYPVILAIEKQGFCELRSQIPCFFSHSLLTEFGEGLGVGLIPCTWKLVDSDFYQKYNNQSY